MKPPYSKKQVKWAFEAEKEGILPKGDALLWAERLKARKNPFLAPAHSSTLKENTKRIPFTFLGAMGAAAFNGLVTDRMPSALHLPMHAALASLTSALPKHSSAAAFGGAMFYALFTETYAAIARSHLFENFKGAKR